jgi:hypothetical protein
MTIQPLRFFPDFFIVGAPRCGTTSLSRYLARHPQICFSEPKEPHYFSQVSKDFSTLEVQENYLARFFRHRQNSHQAVGEGSVSYLYSQQAIDQILKFNPRAKFIAMVRNPIDMIHSYHYRLLFTLDEDVQDFATAWSLQETRARGQQIPKRCREPRFLQYAKVAMLGEQIEGLYEKAGREQSLVIVFDDLITQTEKVYQQALDFLQVDSDGRKTFPRKMASKSYRFLWLQHLLYRPPKPVMRIAATPKTEEKQNATKKPLVKRLRKRLSKINTIKRKPPPLDEVMRTKLKGTFSGDIQRLANLLDRDLSHWT